MFCSPFPITCYRVFLYLLLFLRVLSIDRGLSMSTHVTKFVAGCVAVLHQRNSIRRSVSRESLIGLVVSLVLTRLDYCNAVLAGLPAYR